MLSAWTHWREPLSARGVVGTRLQTPLSDSSALPGGCVEEEGLSCMHACMHASRHGPVSKEPPVLPHMRCCEAAAAPGARRPLHSLYTPCAPTLGPLTRRHCWPCAIAAAPRCQRQQQQQLWMVVLGLFCRACLALVCSCLLRGMCASLVSEALHWLRLLHWRWWRAIDRSPALPLAFAFFPPGKR